MSAHYNHTNTDIAWFAGGCFWGVQYYFKHVPGVLSTRVGFMGGAIKNPTYEQVRTGTTGHLETLEVVFDPNRTSYEELAKLFFEIHDPTQTDGQGPDIGSQYLSAIFYQDNNQKKTIEKLIGILRNQGLEVVTEVRKASTFWSAEDYHQDYYSKKGGNPYCHFRVKRDWQ